MCGRYASSRGVVELTETFAAADETREALEPDFNVAPTKPVPAVLVRGTRDDPTDKQRRLRLLRWGLVPSWAKDPSIGSRLINARAETLADKPAFRKAFATRRCLLPADGFYEWYAGDGSAKQKQPFFLRPRGGGVLAMAGLYELWRDPTDASGETWLWSCTVITTTAADDLGHIHDRSPMVVAEEDWATWLDPALTDVEEVGGLLVPAASGALEAWPVSTAVNNVRNNGPELVEPLAPTP